MQPLGLFCQQASDGVENDLGRLAFRQKPIRELKAVDCLGRSREDENRNFWFQFLHFSGDLCSCFVTQKVVGDYQLNRVLFEKLETVFARVGG